MGNDIKELNLELNRLYKRQDDLYHAYASHYGLSVTSFWILYALCGTEETYTQNMLAKMWHLPSQSINSAISSLVKAGYVRLWPGIIRLSDSPRRGKFSAAKLFLHFMNWKKGFLRKCPRRSARYFLPFPKSSTLS